MTNEHNGRAGLSLFRTRGRRLWRPLMILVSALLGVAGLAVPASAEQTNSVYGYVNANGTWTLYSHTRHHTTPGNIWFKPDNLPSGGMCMELIWTSGVGGHSQSMCWWDHSAKYIAYNVLPGTTFVIEVHKRDARGTDNYWAGTLYY
jgi:hypothetical protein